MEVNRHPGFVQSTEQGIFFLHLSRDQNLMIPAASAVSAARTGQQQAPYKKVSSCLQHPKAFVPCKSWEAVVPANGRIQAIAPNWLGEGTKGLWVQSGQIAFATVKCWVAPVQNKVWVVQEHFLRLLLPCPKRPFAPSPNHFGAICLNWAICQNHSIPMQDQEKEMLGRPS